MGVWTGRRIEEEDRGERNQEKRIDIFEEAGGSVLKIESSQDEKNGKKILVQWSKFAHRISYGGNSGS